MMITRFAPSPTGLLHLGHAYSAGFAWMRAREAGGRFLLRIEDIDFARCRPEFATAIKEDLTWLGFDWDGEVRFQSERFDDYRDALQTLWNKDLIYPCFCTRAEIAAEIERAGAAPQGEEGPLYPGTCRRLPERDGKALMDSGIAYALRLDCAKAASIAGPLWWEDVEAGEIGADPAKLGDVILARKDTATSYHLAVTVDDAAQGVTLVTRGKDLFAATHIHRLLQALLDLPAPRYWHHALITDQDGKRLAKRDRALTIRALRQAERSKEEVRAMAGLA